MQEPQQQQETNSVADVHLGTENIFVLFTVERRDARRVSESPWWRRGATLVKRQHRKRNLNNIKKSDKQEDLHLNSQGQ